MKNIFVSRPTWVASEYQEGLDYFLRFMRGHDLNPRTVGASDYPSKAPMDEVISLMKTCFGAIILGYPQIIVEKGILKDEAIPNTGSSYFLSTEWNHIEAALAYEMKLPLLVIHHIGVKRGVFDRGTIGNFIYERDLINPTWSMQEDINGAFINWKSELSDSIEDNKNKSKTKEIDDWKERAEKYEEYMVAGAGAIVMKHKEKRWYYCPICFERKSIIALKNYGMGSHCPGCKNMFGFSVQTK